MPDTIAPRPIDTATQRLAEAITVEDDSYKGAVVLVICVKEDCSFEMVSNASPDAVPALLGFAMESALRKGASKLPPLQ